MRLFFFFTVHSHFIYYFLNFAFTSYWVFPFSFVIPYTTTLFFSISLSITFILSSRSRITLFSVWFFVLSASIILVFLFSLFPISFNMAVICANLSFFYFTCYVFWCIIHFCFTSVFCVIPGIPRLFYNLLSSNVGPLGSWPNSPTSTVHFIPKFGCLSYLLLLPASTVLCLIAILFSFRYVL